MNWSPIIRDLALVIVVWAAVLWTLHQRRARLGTTPAPRALRSYGLHTAAAISALVGATAFVAWLSTDSIGPPWLHAVSLPAALVFIAVGAVLAGYAGWVGGL